MVDENRVFRLLLLPIGALTLCLLMAVSLIRAQPFDDSAARAVFMPERCPLPCMIDIRPGATRVDEALHILDHHAWVGNYRIRNGNLTAIYMIEWSGSQPTYIDSAAPGQVTNLAPQNLIRSVKVQTTIPAGMLYLLLGEPSSIEIQPSTRANHINFLLRYSEKPFIVRLTAACPFSRRSLWAALVNVEMSSELSRPPQLNTPRPHVSTTRC